jgi:hypothetical protein
VPGSEVVTAKTSPVESKHAYGAVAPEIPLGMCGIIAIHPGCCISHSRIVRSSLELKNRSSTGLIDRFVTLEECPEKVRRTVLS